jgi:hypothetical protein
MVEAGTSPRHGKPVIVREPPKAKNNYFFVCLRAKGVSATSPGDSFPALHENFRHLTRRPARRLSRTCRFGGRTIGDLLLVDLALRERA